MWKRVAAAVVLAAGACGVLAGSAAAETHKPKPGAAVRAELDVDAVVKAVPGVRVRTYDLKKKSDACALLSLIFGLDVQADVDADVAAKVDADAKADAKVKAGR